MKRWEWALVLALFVFNFIPVFGGFVRVIELAGGISIMPANPRAIANPTPIYLHAISSFVFCIIGAFQFLPSIRRKFPSFHKSGGKLIAIFGVIVAASGLWMTHSYHFPETLQGDLLYWVRVMVSLAMAGFIYSAILNIKLGNIARHYTYIIYAYAIALGASTQTVMGLAWQVFIGSELLGFERDLVNSSAWVINSAIAFWVILCIRRKTTVRFPIILE